MTQRTKSGRPPKPSEEAKEVYATLARAADDHHRTGGPFVAGEVLKALAAALVRRYPGLTSKPAIGEGRRAEG